MMNGQEVMECTSMMGSMGIATWIFWILLTALIGWGIYHLIVERGGSTRNRESPVETLQRRYAEGGLSTEEYEERKRNLRGKSARLDTQGRSS